MSSVPRIHFALQLTQQGCRLKRETKEMGGSEVRAVTAPVRDGLREVCAPQPPRWQIHTIFQELHPVTIHRSIICAFSTGAATAEVSNTFHGNDSNTMLPDDEKTLPFTSKDCAGIVHALTDSCYPSVTKDRVKHQRQFRDRAAHSTR